MLSLVAVLLIFYGADAKTSMWEFAPGVGTLVLFIFMLPFTYKQWRQARSRSIDESPIRASPEVQRRSRRLTYYMMFFMPIAVASNLLPFTTEPWIWIKVAIIWAGVIILGVWVTRFPLCQRDEYWREQGKDPQAPRTSCQADAP